MTLIKKNWSPNNASQQCWASQQCPLKNTWKSQQLHVCPPTRTYKH